MSTYGSLPEGWNEVELMSLAFVITDGAHSSPKPQNQGRFMCSMVIHLIWLYWLLRRLLSKLSNWQKSWQRHSSKWLFSIGDFGE